MFDNFHEINFKLHGIQSVLDVIYGFSDYSTLKYRVYSYFGNFVQFKIKNICFVMHVKICFMVILVILTLKFFLSPELDVLQGKVLALFVIIKVQTSEHDYIMSFIGLLK